jgi:pyridoxal phosphate enzyme (YggS family)
MDEPDVRSNVRAAVDGVRERVAAAAERSGRRPSDVRIVAVTKGVGLGPIREAVDAGLVDLGENRAQELRDKAGHVQGARWHFLGGIQSNKVRYLEPVELVHSVDRVEEGQALQAAGERLGRGYDVLIEVNLAGERSKQGVEADEVGPLLEGLGAFAQVRPRGFMLMAPQSENPEDVRWLFAEGRRLGERYEHLGLGELSMGMSDDFEVAVEEGATIVRIGRAIFGERTG